MGKTMVGALCVWVTIAAINFLLVVDPPTATAVAVPEAQPEPCCRGRGLVAGALGFAGGFLIGRHRGRHHGGGGCGGCGCGGCGGGCGWCGGGYYGRKRRSLDEVLENDALEDVYWKISQQDEDQCGLKLVCELAQKDPNYLSEDELVILLPYRGRVKRDTVTYYGQYDQAAWHGQQGHMCNELYPLCVFNSAHMMLDYVNNATLV